MRACLIALLLVATPAFAQESRIGADFRKEGEEVKKNCGAFKTLVSCAITFMTGHPLHVTAGSIAPQNGLAIGGAFVFYTKTEDHWRFSWNADGAMAPGGAWRTGVYLKAVYVGGGIELVSADTPITPSETNGISEHMTLSAYQQSISLPTVGFFGVGPSSNRGDKAFFGLTEHIVGASAVVPLSRWSAGKRLNLAVTGEIDGRFVSIRSGPAGSTPSIEQTFNDATAPGLVSQPSFIDFDEGVRILPHLSSHMLLNYRADLRQVHGDATSSFRRWTMDLNHEIGLFRTTRDQARDYMPPMGRAGRESNGPDDCRSSVDNDACPASRNRGGSINLRVFASRSSVSGGAQVPFYFQPTLGGADIDGNKTLGSYEDYRFRGPDVLFLEQSFEHALTKMFGVWVAAQQGKVSAQDGSFTGAVLRRTYLIGATVRAGGVPMITLSWATGGPEGHHVSMLMNTSLLGGTKRPGLY